MTEVAQLLQDVFGNISFQERADITAIRRFESNTTYCLDEQGRIIGLAVRESSIENVRIPKSLDHLQYLNLSDNKQLHTLIFESSMNRLGHLDVSDSGLLELKLSDCFKGLEWLDASRNKIRAFAPMDNFPNLRYLDLSGNQLRNFDAAWIKKFPKLDGLYLKGNQMGTELSFAELNANCLEAMQEFQRGIEQSGKAKNKDFKVILVGNGGVGKSCLVERLVYETFEEQHKSTHGVSLERFQKPEYQFPYVLNIWDFGGQDIYHATHRLFMQSNAIYLLLWDKYTLENATSPVEENNTTRHYENHDLFYWLDYINLEGKKSPVIVTKTKKLKDGTAEHPERAALRTDCENRGAYFNFIQIDSKEDSENVNGFDYLKLELRKAIETDFQIGDMPQSWADLRSDLQKLQQAKWEIITLDEYLELASKYDLGRPPEKVLTDFLVQSGVVFFKEGYMNNAVVLDQAWIIKAIYTLFDREEGYYYRLLAQEGKFTGKDLIKIWDKQLYTKEAYTQAERELFIKFMMTCQICFETTPKEEHEYPSFEERSFVAPQLLPEKVPSSVKYFQEYNQDHLLYVKYKHRRLHSGIIQSFIVKTNTFAKQDDIWRNGILIEENGKRALIRAERNKTAHQYYIQVEVQKEGLELLSKIQNLLNELQGENVEEWISIDGTAFVLKSKLRDQNDAQAQIVADNGRILGKSLFSAFVGLNTQQHFQTKFEVSDDNNLIKKIREEKRTIHSNSINMEALNNLVGRNRIKEAIQLLIDQAPSSFKAEAIQLQARFSNLERDQRLGTINFSDASVERNKITNAILQFGSTINEAHANPSTITQQPTSKGRIYFSYAWGTNEATGQDREELVNQLYTSLISDGFEAKRDKMDLEYGGLISDFMQEIGEGDLIVVFTSEKYAKSPYCMFELYEIARNSRWDKSVFSSRILPVIVEYIPFNDPLVLDEYFEYWETEEQKWASFIQKRIGQISIAQSKRYDNIKNINHNFGKLSDWLSDINASSNKLLSQNDFEIIKNTILKRLGND